jgi:thiol-disulfide isomerase/thioredoxin
MQTGRSWWPIVVVFCVALALLAFIHRHGVASLMRRVVFGQETPVRAHLEIGEQLPAANFVSLLGTRSTISAEPGHVLVLNVFATWCPDCISEAPALAQLRNVYAHKPVDIIGIDQDEVPTTILQFAQAEGWSFPIYIDDSHQTQRKLGVHFIPATFVVDDRGRIWADVAGPLTLPEMESLVQRGLAHLSGRG